MTPDQHPSDEDKHAFLTAAAHHRVEDVLRYLNKFGDTIINHADKDNWTALMMLSAYSSDKEIIQFLLEKGADPHVVSRTGNTATVLARKHGHPEIAAFLDQWNEAQQKLQDQITLSQKRIDLLRRQKPAQSPFQRSTA